MAASRDDLASGQETEGEAGGGTEDGSQSPREDTPPAPCAAFCGPRSCSTLPPTLSQQQAQTASEPKRRRLWGLRGLVKMFRRRVRRRAGESVSPQPPQPTLRARSTSELAVDIQHSSRSSGGPYNQGLSVSHDSVFSPDAAADAHGHSTPPALAIATRGVNMAELKAALRRRRGDDSGSGDDDPGLPRSPPTSPTTLDVLNHGLKSCSRATQSTCSDGSLLSMGSSENDEDSLGAGSHHSSKVSLLEGRHQVVECNSKLHAESHAEYPTKGPSKQSKCVSKRVSTRRSYVSDSIIDGRDPFMKDIGKESDNEPVAGAVRLSHQAAFHKISVRPRRTHGAPRARRATQIGGQMSLPDVIEEANSKNSTSQKLTTVRAASPSPSPALPESNILEEPSSSSNEHETCVEHQESDKKDKEEKRDEPLFQRLFGGRISGRRPSRGSGDDSRENSVSPLRRGGDQRASREKRRDSGSRFPVIGGASKTRQESHPLPPSGRPREPSKERVTKEVPSSSPQVACSVNAEGHMESTASGHQATFRITSFDEHPSRPPEGVRKAKSFREVPEQNIAHRNIVRRKVSPHTNVEDQSGVPAKVSRLSSSLESLDGDDDMRKSSARPVAPSKITQMEMSGSPQRSSTDSLTTTPLPGVFIRQHSQNQNKTVLMKHQEHLQQLHQQQLSGQELNSGPFSLDSSIGIHSRESEEFLRKAASVDHMTFAVDPEYLTKEAETTELATKAAEAKPIPGSQINSLEEKTESGKPEGKKSPGQTLRSHPIQKGEESPSQGPTPDEGEGEGESVPHRPVRKEPSMKRPPLRDPKPTQVPEFMRIQLNRVESKGQSVIYDTEQERNSKSDSKEVEVSNKKPETSSAMESTQKELQISDRLPESFSTPKKEASSVPTSKENKTPTSLGKKSNVQGNKGLFRDVSPSGSNAESGDGDSSVEGSLPEPSLDRVVLRKPLVSERASVMERSTTVTSQTPPSPSKREQPELFKVFARRSFKVKDVEKDKSESSDNDETNVEASSEVSEVTVSPVRAHNNTSPAPVSIGSSLTSVSTSQSSTDVLQKPSINAISFNRKSVGNPALSFCPPPVSTSNAPLSSPVSSKPMVLILSSNNNTDTSSTEITITSSLPRSITTITTTSNSITTSSSQSKPNTTPIQVSTVRPANTTSVAPAAPESFITVSTTPPGIISKIISNRSSSFTSINDSGCGNESDSSPAAPLITPAPSKSTVSSRSGSGLIWPPRPQLDQEDFLQPAQQPQIPAVLPNALNTQQKKLSTSSVSDGEGTQDFEQTEEIEVEISPLDISAARRRFMSGGKDRSHGPTTPSTQNILPASTSPVLSPFQSGSTSSPSPGTPVSLTNKSGPSVTEARNNTPSFTITVRTQAASTSCRSDTLPTSASVTSSSTDLISSTVSTCSNTSVGKSEQGAAQQAADDWRVLVRQRREGRLKQTKTPDSEEIIIETRPPVSRNSKVLEMANNFQKLQVA
ncbi:uncharacterized protein [Panulirus ornatus]|uniref:uncharacterized protein isoform X3 n=1 Tax=Panulirus ornatus TaxID=150431 RepID=UPI003A88D461